MQIVNYRFGQRIFAHVLIGVSALMEECGTYKNKAGDTFTYWLVDGNHLDVVEFLMDLLSEPFDLPLNPDGSLALEPEEFFVEICEKQVSAYLDDLFVNNYGPSTTSRIAQFISFRAKQQAKRKTNLIA